MSNGGDHVSRAASFLAGTQLTVPELEALRNACLAVNDVSTGREVIEHARKHPKSVRDMDKATRRQQDKLWIREAVLTSKDPELAASYRHDEALRLLAQRFGMLEDPDLDDPEVLGVAGGICKRRWQDLGQSVDLRRAASLYERGARKGLGSDAYCQINAAFLDELLASLGDDRDSRLMRARDLRERIVKELPRSEEIVEDCRWWNAASRAEALFGLGRYAEATVCINAVASCPPAPWELESTVRQLSQLAHLQLEKPLDNAEVRGFFDVLIPGGSQPMLSAVMGRVGLALSGGGFRASFFHLGVLAKLAELDVLRHISILSCVSGGSIVGACYWMLLRQKLQEKEQLARSDYIDVITNLINHFRGAVDKNLRGKIQPSKIQVAWRMIANEERGALDPEHGARVLNEWFYEPLGQRLGCSADMYMHELEFQPKGHAESHGGRPFKPGMDNWLRHDKVPVLVINATTVNTGHAWQFTPTWMGESPWAVHEAADAVPRLEWAWYDSQAGWQMKLSRAVAASACVPGVFAPLELGDLYEGGVKVRLVDGGVHDNQGTVALLASNCNIVLISDACGQLLFEDVGVGGLKGLAAYGKRSMDMLMERVRLANFSDLNSRRQVGLLQGLMFVHMKSGLDADVKRRTLSQKSYTIERTVLSPSGVRKDFQKALAELRTDLDDFTEDEQLALMACGYQMTRSAAERDAATIPGLIACPANGEVEWVFAEMHTEITSTSDSTPRRGPLLEAFARGAIIVS